ncbi:MAG: pyruvate kinase [Bacilli bacterium]|nr:pyruvate kinase [Bacilli bacterium]
MKKTKIICSIGPSSQDPNVMEEMVNVGMNVARINFSHATVEGSLEIINSVKAVRHRTGKNIGLLFDTKGPEFRNDDVIEGGIELENGNTIRVVKEHILGNKEKFSVNHPEALDSIKIGDKILLENGLMEIEVISKEVDGVTCKIISGGNLGSKKSLNVPGVHLNVPFMSDKDREDIIFACQNDGDFLAASFVSCADDVREIRKIIEEQGSEMKIISKIENTMAIKNIEEIISESDGIMVARGDLGVEASMEDLPHYQKDIIRRCREHSKFVIVATEMLESMKENLRPTRAEVSDVANAMLDGADAVMLSGETTVGKHPVEVVRVMADICEKQEKYAVFDRNYHFERKNNIVETVATSAVLAADDLDAKLIVTGTLSGYTARKLSNMKPECIIFATCHKEKVARMLSLNYGVETEVIDFYRSTDDMIDNSIRIAKSKFDLKPDDLVVVTGGFTENMFEEHTTNLMKIVRIK